MGQPSIDYASLKAGQTDPSLGKVIKTIIYSNDNCIVFIDSEDCIQWVDEIESGAEVKFGYIVNKMSYWESICNKLFKDNTAYENKSLLAEGLARVFSNNASSNKYAEADEILETTINKIKIEGETILRNDYVMASLWTFIILIVLIISEEVFKKQVISNLSYDWHSICQTAMLGGVGAFVSAITRAKDFKPEIIVDAKIHKLDGVLRVVLGVLTGIFIWLGIKSNLVFSFLNSANKSHYIILFLGMVSGVSERILPTIVKQFENKVDSDTKKPVKEEDKSAIKNPDVDSQKTKSVTEG